MALVAEMPSRVFGAGSESPLALTADSFHSAAGRARLAQSSALVIGAGGLGTPCLLYLAAAGVGQLTLLDDDTIEASNLARQLLYGPDDLGKSKAAVAGQKLTRQFPACRVRAYGERLTAENARAYSAGSDLVVDASDNLATRLMINDAAYGVGTPLITGAIGGTLGLVATFLDGFPCYRCVLPVFGDRGTEPLPQASRHATGAPTEATGATKATEATETPTDTTQAPTDTTGAPRGTIGGIGATEAPTDTTGASTGTIEAPTASTEPQAPRHATEGTTEAPRATTEATEAPKAPTEPQAPTAPVEASVPSVPSVPPEPPRQPVSGPLAGTIGALMANEALKLLLFGAKPTLAGKVLLFDGLAGSPQILTSQFRPDCLTCGKNRG